MLCTLEVCRRVLGNAHPDTLYTERWLEDARSSMRAEQPTKKAGKAAARRNERAHLSKACSSTGLQSPGVLGPEKARKFCFPVSNRKVG